jgi:hypothetical protein
MPKALRTKLGHAAIDSGRSMNAEILARLEASFTPDPGTLIATALQPIGGLSDADRERIGALLKEVGDLLSQR